MTAIAICRVRTAHQPFSLHQPLGIPPRCRVRTAHQPFSLHQPLRLAPTSLWGTHDPPRCRVRTAHQPFSATAFIGGYQPNISRLRGDRWISLSPSFPVHVGIGCALRTSLWGLQHHPCKHPPRRACIIPGWKPSGYPNSSVSPGSISYPKRQLHLLRTKPFDQPLLGPTKLGRILSNDQQSFQNTTRRRLVYVETVPGNNAIQPYLPSIQSPENISRLRGDKNVKLADAF